VSPVEAFRKCPQDGCPVHVWGTVGLDNYCRKHGGNRLGFAEIDDDEYGNPRAASAADPSPAAPRP
jgi:hypothetical protein